MARQPETKAGQTWAEAHLPALTGPFIGQGLPLQDLRSGLRCHGRPGVLAPAQGFRSPLLQGVRQLVGEQAPSSRGVESGLAGAEHHMGSHGVGPRLHRTG